jgi:endo-1,4-beta-xylanase
VPGAAGAAALAPEPANPPEGSAAASGGVGEALDPDIGLDGSETVGMGTDAPGPSSPEAAPPGAEEPPSPPQVLRDAAELSGRLIGTAIPANRLNDESFANAAREFNFVTPENEMKWQSTEPNPGQFNFGAADRIVQFAEDNDMLVKGHTLVWHSQLAGWVRGLTTRDEVLDAMTQHINTVVTHFKGRVHAWDVVNEAFNGTRLRGSDPNDNSAANAAANNSGNNGPDSIFRRLIGADYIDRAFALADAADPDALLFYNDFGAEGINGKSDAVFAMVQGMVQRGVPIDGVGLQMHVSINSNQAFVQQVAQNIERLTALGLQVQISELDVSLCGNAAVETRRQQQREVFAGITAACAAQPLCTAITVWGVADSNSWRDSECNGGRSEPLLFDRSYQRKDVYDSVFDAFVAAGEK